MSELDDKLHTLEVWRNDLNETHHSSNGLVVHMYTPVVEFKTLLTAIVDIVNTLRKEQAALGKEEG